MVRTIFYTSLFLILIGCRMIHNKKEFTLLNYQEKETKLKTNGYYYCIFDRDSVQTKNGGRGIYMKVLLNDNIIHNFNNGYGNDCGKIVELDCEIKKSEEMLLEYQALNHTRKRNKNYDVWDWGKYSTKGDTIRMQWFYNKFGEYYLVEEVGIVIDSTSFKLLRRIDYGNNTSWKMDKTYIFKAFPVKKIYDKVPLFNEIIK